jgi:hypothetical protein
MARLIGSRACFWWCFTFALSENVDWCFPQPTIVLPAPHSRLHQHPRLRTTRNPTVKARDDLLSSATVTAERRSSFRLTKSQIRLNSPWMQSHAVAVAAAETFNIDGRCYTVRSTKYVRTVAIWAPLHLSNL